MSREVLLEPLLRRLRLRQVLPHLPSGGHLLDIGCGHSAALLRAVAPRIRQGVGIDYKVAPMQLGHIQTIQQRLTDRLPFPDASFEVVTLLAVLEHLEAEQPILAEIRRVLQPNGKLVLTVPSIWAQPVLEFLSYRLKLIDEREIRDHKRYYDRSRLYRALVEQAQFRQFQHRYFQWGMNNFCTVIK